MGYGHTVSDTFEIQAMVGFGVDGVRFEPVDGFPNITYSFLRPALVGRVRAHETAFVVDAGLGGRIGLDGGELQAAYGPDLQHGGVEVFFGFSGLLDPGIAYAARTSLGRSSPPSFR